MQVFANHMWVSPQTTDHRLGLPSLTRFNQPKERVEPIDTKSKDRLDVGTRNERAPQQTRRDGSPDPETHVAPPSIMQLKIAAMLEDQASAKREAEAEMPSDTDSAAQPEAEAEDRTLAQPDDTTDAAPPTPLGDDPAPEPARDEKYSLPEATPGSLSLETRA
ncbi:MAG: hypothetical protein QNJ09_17840 [Paracoccaceae bacterium]|nr:hypothetical protein [Paracoccaceae bacterium]